MQSKNPIFARSEQFKGTANANGNLTYPGNGAQHAGYGADPSHWSVGSPTHEEIGSGRMTIDTVVQKTGMTLGVVVLTAAATWLLTGDPRAAALDNTNAATSLYGLAMFGALGGFVLAMVNSFKKVISPALVIAYAALEGVFIGAMSKVFDATFDQPGQHGIVVGAVIGTVAAFAGTLAAYKFFNIQVGSKFRMWVVGMMFGFVGLTLLDMLLGFFGKDFGFNGFGTLGLLSSVFGLGLGVLMLILDFDYVERGIANGIPEVESWRAAFGLTVTIVWIYIELLRILAILTRR